VKEGRFREDFYYRINVFTIDVPPLRARPSDIPLLAEHFVRQFAQRMDKRITGIGPEAMAALRAHDWPGNVRELANAIERAMVVGRPPLIRAEDLPLWSARKAAPAGETLADVEKAHIAAVLERTGWNVTRAAATLGIDRVTVYNKMRKYGLQREGAPGEEAAPVSGRGC
jgi:DNA-binding NtrC family response regulator